MHGSRPQSPLLSATPTKSRYSPKKNLDAAPSLKEYSAPKRLPPSGNRPGHRNTSDIPNQPVFVHNLFIKTGGEHLQYPEVSLYLLPVKVPRRRLPAWDQKGTPVQIRDYPRSCKLHCVPHTLRATVRRTGRRAEGASQKTCLTDIRHLLSGYRAVQQLFLH